LPLFGKYNIENALSVISIALLEGVSELYIKKCLESYQGAEQRQEILFDKGDVVLISDFAHHPTAVSLTLEGLRDRYPSKRIIAIFEPRSNTSRRKDFEKPYMKSFSPADIVFIAKPVIRHNDIVDNMMDIEKVVLGIGKNAYAYEKTDDIITEVKKVISTGDVIVIMSNGFFDGIAEKLQNFLETNTSRRF
jgi:UDP-N-acetylmuramate: L-alanyl-gamma-D-glutamyl-meso-diaminopimelate ligase